MFLLFTFELSSSLIKNYISRVSQIRVFIYRKIVLRLNTIIKIVILIYPQIHNYMVLKFYKINNKNCLIHILNIFVMYCYLFVSFYCRFL